MYINISQEKSVVILLPIMDVTKLLLTTPELRILITVHFDYLWVVFFSGFQQYTMSFRTTQVKMNFLTMHAFILYFHFSNTITDILKNRRRWRSRLQPLNERIPTIIYFIAHLSVCSIFTKLFYLHAFNY